MKVKMRVRIKASKSASIAILGDDVVVRIGKRWRGARSIGRRG